MFLIFILCAFLSVSRPALAEDGLQQVLADTSALPDTAPVDAAELDRFYALRGYRPAWNVADDAAIAKTLAFIDSLQALVAYHGLDREGYRFEAMQKMAASTDAADRQKLEFLITASLLHLAHDLHGDDVDLSKLYMGWNFHRKKADIPDLLNAAIKEGKIEEFFAKIAPQQEGYRELAKALQIYREMKHWTGVTPGPSLKPGDRGPRVAQLRARLTAEGYMTPTLGAAAIGFVTGASVTPDAQDDVLDDNLDKALMAYQARNGLEADGHAGQRTQDALNVSTRMRVAQIRANMERWRHMPENFPPERYLIVNIPDFTVTIFEDGKEIYHGEVVDGKVDRQTPFVNSQIYNMVINPSWHVPVSIARKDIYPKLRKDPHYLERLGIVIAGREDDPSGVAIDWESVDPKTADYTLRQVPGDMNSLGQLKFNFNNPFDVYMHGTPHHELFAKAERTFSSGCVRLEEPERVGEILLENNKTNEGIKGGWTQEYIEQEIGAGKTYAVTLAKPMPIYFLYWSVFPGADGQVNFRRDVYGYDESLRQAMASATNLTRP